MQLKIDNAWTQADLDLIHRFITTSYWAEGISRELLEKAMTGSLNFILREPDGSLVGYARVVTDQATFAYLCDVFVLEQRRGFGYGKQLIEAVMAAEPLQGLRRFLLFTKDAHGLYDQYGFGSLAEPDRAMEISRPRLYLD